MSATTATLASSMTEAPPDELDPSETTSAATAICRAFTQAPSPCVVTIGTFDGLHAGHQSVISVGRAQADREGLPLVAVTFNPRPELIFAPNALPDLDSSIEDRVARLRQAGVQHVCVLPFNRDVAAMTYRAFVRHLLHDLGARTLVVGEDFHFGRNKSGNPKQITELGLPTVAVPLVRGAGDEKVSSTTFRIARARGGVES